eukprot:TRINITY_DN3247_c0_g1_i1.p1 TRINITY_DN3247_c0_g1~~TRINITY_DN3247_c0_g1_i1.p1  ORF type:complete len:415 (+),score=110.83 TRINITY_DN3247_c0_g1_i1:900-2144(+)
MKRASLIRLLLAACAAGALTVQLFPGTFPMFWEDGDKDSGTGAPCSAAAAAAWSWEYVTLKYWKPTRGSTLTASGTGTARLEEWRPRRSRARERPLWIEIDVVTRPVRTLAVYAPDVQSASPNVWHRYTFLYGAFLARELARRMYGIDAERVTVLLKCEDEEELAQLRNAGVRWPTGWAMHGALGCSEDEGAYDAVVNLGTAHGVMWALAWDGNFGACAAAGAASGMYEAWAALQRGAVDAAGRPVLAPAAPPPMSGPALCFIDRAEGAERNLVNLDEILAMLERVAPGRVRKIRAVARWTEEDLLAEFYDCGVLFGVHGAGWTNVIYTQPSCTAVEVAPARPFEDWQGERFSGPPRYYANMCGLLGRHYEVVADWSASINDVWWEMSAAVLKDAEAALQRALQEHAKARARAP